MCERCDEMRALAGASVGLSVLPDGRVMVVGTVQDDQALHRILESAMLGFERLIEERRAARKRRLH